MTCMVRLAAIVTLGLLAFAAGAAGAGGAEPTGSDWVGEYQGKGKPVFIRLQLREGEKGVRGLLDIPLERSRGLALESMRWTTSAVHFEIPSGSERLVFDGKVDGNSVSGAFERSGEHGTFQLLRLAVVDPALLVRYAGTYRIGAGQLLYIGPRGGFTDYSSGRFGVLSPLSDTEFFLGPSMGVNFPVDLRVTFLRQGNGHASGLRLQQKGARDRDAERVEAFREEEVGFRNGDVTLSGTLLVPAGEGPHPTVVFVHGGMDQTRRSIGPHPYLFAAHGVAAFIYDKRGCGASTGDWRTATFDDLAGDALAGVELLKGRNDIRAGQIGLWGISQGGWLSPLAASRSRDIVFVVAVSGPAVSPARQALYVTETALRGEGFADDAVSRALGLQRLLDDVMRGRSKSDELETALRGAKEEKWFPLVAPPPKDDWSWDWWPKVMDFDPMPVLENVSCPVLFIYGGLDQLVWVEESVPILQEALKRAGNRDATIKVFSNGNHDLYEADLETSRQYDRLRGFVPGYFQLMTEWIRNRVTVK